MNIFAFQDFLERALASAGYVIVGAVGSGAPGRITIMAPGAELGDEIGHEKVLAYGDTVSFMVREMSGGYRPQLRLQVPQVDIANEPFNQAARNKLERSESLILWREHLLHLLVYRHGRNFAAPTVRDPDGVVYIWMGGAWLAHAAEQLGERQLLLGSHIAPDIADEGWEKLLRPLDMGAVRDHASRSGSEERLMALELMMWRRWADRSTSSLDPLVQCALDGLVVVPMGDWLALHR